MQHWKSLLKISPRRDYKKKAVAPIQRAENTESETKGSKSFGGFTDEFRPLPKPKCRSIAALIDIDWHSLTFSDIDWHDEPGSYPQKIPWNSAIQYARATLQWWPNVLRPGDWRWKRWKRWKWWKARQRALGRSLAAMLIFWWLLNPFQWGIPIPKMDGVG